MDTPGVTLEPPELQPSVLGERVELPESNVDRVAAFSVSRALGLAQVTTVFLSFMATTATSVL
jgi:hypothetical protein